MKPSTPITHQPSAISKRGGPQQPKAGPKNWAPWSTDPDPPARRFTPEERKKVRQNVSDFYLRNGLLKAKPIPPGDARGNFDEFVRNLGKPK